jgi:heme exporter protein A
MAGATHVVLEGAGRSYGSRTVIRGISATIPDRSSFLAWGPNGSGKTTLMAMICGLVACTRGKVLISVDGHMLDACGRRRQLGLVSPMLGLYPQLTAEEHVELSLKARGLAFDRAAVRALLEKMGLGRRGRDPLSAYSTGMSQRLKYALAIAHAPRILVLDEPFSNLDQEGVAMARAVMYDHERRGIVIAAACDRREWTDAHMVLSLAPV